MPNVCVADFAMKSSSLLSRVILLFVAFEAAFISLLQGQVSPHQRDYVSAHLFEQYDGLPFDGPVPDDIRLCFSNDQSATAYSIIASGKVVYGDAVSRLINGIADTLPPNHNGARLRFYTLKSYETSIVSLPTGVFLVPVGLVARVENREQLALCLKRAIFNEQYAADSLCYEWLPSSVYDDVSLCEFDSVLFHIPYYALPPVFCDDDAPAQSERNEAFSEDLEFEYVRQLAAFECVRQEIINADYVRALYDCLVLLRRYPANPFLEKSLCRSLYGMTEFRFRHGIDGMSSRYEGRNAALSRFHDALRKVDKEDLSLVAVRKLWEFHRLYPDDPEPLEMLDGIFRKMYYSLGWTPGFFSPRRPEASSTDWTQEGLSKYERMRMRKDSSPYVYPRSYALTDFIMGDEEFRNFVIAHLDRQPGQTVDCSVFSVVSQLVCLTGDSSSYSAYCSKVEGDVSSAAAKSGIKSVSFSPGRLCTMTTADEYREWLDFMEWSTELQQTRCEGMHLATQRRLNRLADKYYATSVNLTTLHRHTKNSVSVLQLDSRDSRTICSHNFLVGGINRRVVMRSMMRNHFKNLGRDSTLGAPSLLSQHLHLTLSATIGLGNFFTYFGGFDMPRRLSVRDGFFSLSPSLGVDWLLVNNLSLHLSAGVLLSSVASSGEFDYETTFCNLNVFPVSVGLRFHREMFMEGKYFEFGFLLAPYHLHADTETESFSNILFGPQISYGVDYLFHDHFQYGLWLGSSLLFGGRMLGPTIVESSNLQVFLSNLFRVGLTISFQP